MATNCTIFKRLCFILTVSLTAFNSLHAQETEGAAAELLENFFRDNEGATESDAQLFLEYLDDLRQHPLNLNRATREDLAQIRLLSGVQIESFLAYRAQNGDLLATHELQAVPHWDLDEIRLLLPFIRIDGAGLDQRGTRLINGFRKGDSEALIRMGQYFPLKQSEDYEGGPQAVGVRFRHNFDNRMRYGFTLESDAGEALFAGSNRKTGFDFVSAHFFVRRPGKHIRALALGDFSARLGQGMLLQTGFAPGKSAESVQVLRGGPSLNAYGAFGEIYFLRGGGFTAGWGNWEATVFASHQKRDATVDTLNINESEEIFFSSIQSSGLHRTRSEIENENAVGETLLGMSAAWRKTRGHVAINALQMRFDQTRMLQEAAAYRRFVFTGNMLTALSVDYQYRIRNLVFWGENARSDNGGLAFLNGVLVGADRRTTFVVLHRDYSPEYQTFYGAPFAESSGANNERGLYIGLEARPNKPWKINFYADVWRHPWLRFDVGGPSVGRDFLTRVMWTPSKTWSSYLLFQSETKESDGEDGGLAENNRKRLRLHTGYKVSPEWELRSRVEWTRVKKGAAAPAYGFLAYQEIVMKLRGLPFSGAYRYAIFDTDDYDSRVYSFENDLFAAVSIPGFSGRGNRQYLNFSWRISKLWRLESRFETTWLQHAVTLGTPAARYSVIKLQARAKW